MVKSYTKFNLSTIVVRTIASTLGALFPLHGVLGYRRNLVKKYHKAVFSFLNRFITKLKPTADSQVVAVSKNIITR